MIYRCDILCFADGDAVLGEDSCAIIIAYLAYSKKWGCNVSNSMASGGLVGELWDADVALAVAMQFSFVCCGGGDAGCCCLIF